MPARKRRTSRSPRRHARGRATKQGLYLAGLFVVASLVALVALIVIVRYRAKPKPSRRQPAAVPATRRHGPLLDAARLASISAHCNQAIQSAGGDDVWLKRAAEPASGAGQAEPKGTVLALAQASPRILSALERQAAKDGVQLSVRESKGLAGVSAGSLIETLSITERNEPVCAWTLREVPRLYRAAIVIDDLGQALAPARELLRIPFPLTFSVLPNLPESRETATEANRAGREIMLHLPMEPLAAPRVSPGPGAILVGMNDREVDKTMEDDLASVPYVSGVNNHMGSRATSDPVLMREVMKELAARRLYFIDSRTIASSVALEAARRAGVPSFYRSVFLDDTETVGYSLGQLRKLSAAVEDQGMALAIGHPHPTTIKALEEFLPELESEDIELVPASRLVRLAERARLAPASGYADGIR